MQKIIVSGRLTKDILKHDGRNGGDAFYTMSLAANRKMKGEEITTYYDVICDASRRIAALEKYLTKGTAIMVTGDLSASFYDRNDGSKAIRLSINADAVEFNSVGGKRDDNAQAAGADGPAAAPKAAKASKPAKEAEPEYIVMTSTGSPTEADDDLPF